MSICVVFLGTGAAVPTPQRSLPAVLLQRGNEQLMFDCGEAVQRQMMIAKVGLHKKLGIYITHMHGDHVLGLPGLLQTMALMDRKKPVDIYGPEGMAYFLDCLRETLQFQLTFQVNVHEIAEPGVSLRRRRIHRDSDTVQSRGHQASVMHLLRNPALDGFIPRKPKPWVFRWAKHGADFSTEKNSYFPTVA